MNTDIFRAYDIRGLADTDLDDAVVTELGRALGSAVRAEDGDRIVVGRDARASSPRLFRALTAGLNAAGVHVVDLGIVPTPVCYFAANLWDDVHGLAMITGSHNPPDHNGLKCGVGTMTLGGAFIQGLKTRIEQGEFAEGRGTLETRDALVPYQAYLAENLDFGPRKLKVIVDAGNGTGAITAIPMLEAAGFEVHGLYVEPDGTFPNHEADPTVEANLADLKAAVKKRKADLGVAYDGDADRLGVVDEAGQVIWGDRLMILFARSVLAARGGGAVVGEVKCSQTLYDAIAEAGGEPIMWAAGHSLIKAKMKETRAVLGGEMSGHIFFADRFFGFDDACYATGRLLELLSRTEGALSALLADVPETVSTPELRVPCAEAVKFEVVEKVSARLAKDHEVITVDGARVELEGGWGLVRASNTQPILVLRFEAESEERLGEIRALVDGVLGDVMKEVAA